jgi:DNA-binding GntR family transcriptional regulator
VRAAADNSTLRFDRGERRQAIVESILADVFGGRLRAGQHLVTQDLAERFGVSHTPIREALIALAGIGVIDLLPNRGAVVRQVSAKDVREVCQVRRVLECEAVRRACGRIGLAELESLAMELQELLKRSGGRARVLPSRTPATGRGFERDEARFIEQARAVDSRLHDTIAASCGNDFLAAELSRLKTLFRALRDVSWAYDKSRNDFRRLAGEAREHLAIVEALLTGNGREAARAMSRHIRSGIKYWSRSIPAASSAAAKQVGSAKLNGKQPHRAAKTNRGAST